MDGEDAVVGRHGGELIHGRLEVGAIAIGGLPGLVRAGAILRLIAGHDADRGKRDARAVEVDAAGMDRLIEIAADAGIGDGLLGVGHGDMVERLLDALRAVVVGMVIGEREQIEARIDQRFQRGRVTAEMKRALALAFRREVVAIGDDGLEIDEGKIAVDLAGDPGKRVGEARELLAFAHAAGLDLGVGRVEAGIADEHDGEAIESGGMRRRWLNAADRSRKLGAVARGGARGGMEQAADNRKNPDAGRYNAKTLEPASCHGHKTLTSRPGPPPDGRAD